MICNMKPCNITSSSLRVIKLQPRFKNYSISYLRVLFHSQFLLTYWYIYKPQDQRKRMHSCYNYFFIHISVLECNIFYYQINGLIKGKSNTIILMIGPLKLSLQSDSNQSLKYIDILLLKRYILSNFTQVSCSRHLMDNARFTITQHCDIYYHYLKTGQFIQTLVDLIVYYHIMSLIHLKS